MTHLGERLKKERERKGLALRQVHEATKIQTRYLAALEAREWNAFPGEVFVRGYLRTYAEFLKLDPEQALKAYARERRLEHTAAGTAPADAAEEQRQAVRAVLERIGQTRGVERSMRTRALRILTIGSAVVVVCALTAWGALQNRTPPAGASAGEGFRRSRQPQRSSFEPTPAATPTNVVASGFAAGATTEDPPGPIPATATRPEDTAPPPSTETDARAPAPAASAVLPREPAQPATTLESPAPRKAATSPPSSATDPAPASDAGPRSTVHARLSVAEHGVGAGIDDHQLIGESREFQPGAAVWFWTLVRGGRSGDQVRHVWIHEGRRVGVVRLRVSGPEWRTQSRRVMAPGSEGVWTVEARDPKDELLAVSRFRVGNRSEMAR